jgi:hypothetical protein
MDASVRTEEDPLSKYFPCFQLRLNRARHRKIDLNKLSGRALLQILLTDVLIHHALARRVQIQLHCAEVIGVWLLYGNLYVDRNHVSDQTNCGRCAH